MTKRLIADIGNALYEVSCRADAHMPTLESAINAIAEALDYDGQDYRLFLQAAGASDAEQDAGHMGGVK